jgi:dipeptidyl aminopeptidase/acylaminoacyl peptidase
VLTMKQKAMVNGQWSTLMQDDITDATNATNATNAIIASGVADAKRICMFGGSYGAYASMMGAIKEPDLYRCVIGLAGVFRSAYWG